MEAEEAPGPPGRGRQLGDREARGVRGQQRLRLARPIQLCEQLLLEAQALGRGLDHQVAVREILEPHGSLEIRERLLHVGGHELPFVHAALQELADRAHALFEERLRDLAHHGRESRLGAHMRDAAAHEPTAHNAHFADWHEAHTSSSARSQQPAPARRIGGRTAGGKKPGDPRAFLGRCVLHEDRRTSQRVAKLITVGQLHGRE